MEPEQTKEQLDRKELLNKWYEIQKKIDEQILAGFTDDEKVVIRKYELMKNLTMAGIGISIGALVGVVENIEKQK